LSDLQIEALTPANAQAIAPILKTSHFKPLRYLAREQGDSLDSHWQHSVEDLLPSERTHAFLASRGGEPVGFLVYAESPWESDLFGQKAGVLHHFALSESAGHRGPLARELLDHALRHAHSIGMRFLSTKVYADDVPVIHALESRGFLLMDTVVECHFDARRTPLAGVAPPKVAADVVLRLATPADRDGLVAASRLAFGGHFGRFHSDERIGRDVATKIYEQWMHSSLDGYADWIDVAEIDGRIAGFSIWKKPARRDLELAVPVGHYSISGIHPEFHGRGLFTALTYAGTERMLAFADIVEGPTHVNNVGVQLGYAKVAWRVGSDARHSFHKWFDPA
jgi:ribosomal protein S18 acetylase RimI-like enzyme